VLPHGDGGNGKRGMIAGVARAMFEGFQRITVQCDDVAINAVTGGNGPPVLLLHGFPQCLALWANVAPILAKSYTVVCADLRGYGDSGKPHESTDYANYSFRAMAGDNVQLMSSLGFETFHLVGHDRGGRVGHRLALDHPGKLLSLSLLDIVPTHTMFVETNRKVAGTYWHWYFLSQPAPFPETLIASNPDFFYETCLMGWGAAKASDFDAGQLAEYRRCWRNGGMIHGSCADYRAAATVDLRLDDADRGRRVKCPTLVYYGAKGVMAQCFDIPETWRPWLANMSVATADGVHFFVDQMPEETAGTLLAFLQANAS
jgi:haloacetate dehalogenase